MAILGWWGTGGTGFSAPQLSNPELAGNSHRLSARITSQELLIRHSETLDHMQFDASRELLDSRILRGD